MKYTIINDMINETIAPRSAPPMDNSGENIVAINVNSGTITKPMIKLSTIANTIITIQRNQSMY